LARKISKAPTKEISPLLRWQLWSVPFVVAIGCGLVMGLLIIVQAEANRRWHNERRREVVNEVKKDAREKFDFVREEANEAQRKIQAEVDQLEAATREK
jgi:hypothetical protein